MEENQKSFSDKANEYADKYEEELRKTTENIIIVGTEAINRGIKTVDDVKKDIMENANKLKTNIKSEIGNISDSIQIYAMIGAEKLCDAKAKGLDLIETAQIYSMIGKDKVVDLIKAGKDGLETAEIIGLLGIDEAKKLIDKGIIKGKEFVKTVEEKVSEKKEYVEGKINAGKTYVTDKARQGKEYVENKVNAGKTYVTDKAKQGKEFVIDTAEKGAGAAIAAGRIGKDIGKIGVGAAVITITGVAKATRDGIKQGKEYFGPKAEFIKGLPGLGKKIIKDKAKEGKEYVEGKVNAGKTYVTDKAKEGKEYVENKVNAGKTYVTDKARQGKEYVENKVNTGKTYVTDKARQGKEYVEGKVNAGKTYVTDKAKQGKEFVIDTAEKGAGAAIAAGRIGKDIGKIGVGAAVITITGVAKATREGIKQGKEYFGPKAEFIKGLPGLGKKIITDKAKEGKEYVEGKVNAGKTYVEGKVQDAKYFKEDAMFIVKNRGKSKLSSILTRIRDGSNVLLERLGPSLTQDEISRQAQEQKDIRNQINKRNQVDKSDGR